MLSLTRPHIQFYRDDLNHTTVSGNKLHKLKPNIELAKSLGCSALASFGGAYSNHLHALAWASQEAGLASIGLVRGELHSQLTPTLNDCKSWGMQLFPTDRNAYRDLQNTLLSNQGPFFAEQLLPALIADAPKNTLVIPEGGSNLLAIESVARAYRKIFLDPQYQDITHAICATGTGATLAGLYKAAPATVQVMGIQAVAEGDATIKRIRGWLDNEPPNLKVIAGHLGGFAKTPIELLRFIDEFESTHGIPLDPIYNGKVLFKLWQMMGKGHFTGAEKILVIHTGGAQGTRGIERQESQRHSAW